MDKVCPDKGAWELQVGARSQEGVHVWTGQCNAQQGLGAGGMCMGQEIGGVTPQHQRLQEVLRLMVGLEPMQLLHVKQILV